MKVNFDYERLIKLNNYVDILLNCPKKIPIMCELERDKIYRKYIEESFYYHEFIENEDTVLDLGSGAGFPGIPLAIAFPNSYFYLVDRKENVCNFLKSVKENLNLENVFILNIRAEELKKRKLKFNKVVARAFNRVNFILNLVNDLLIENGFVILGKGKNINNEINPLVNENFILIEKRKTHFGYIVAFKKII